jgi:hypothetical protein
MRALSILGLVLLGIGCCILTGYGLYHFIRAEKIPLIIKVTLLVIIGGIACILLSLIRERVKEIKK